MILKDVFLILLYAFFSKIHHNQKPEKFRKNAGCYSLRFLKE